MNSMNINALSFGKTYNPIRVPNADAANMAQELVLYVPQAEITIFPAHKSSDTRRLQIKGLDVDDSKIDAIIQYHTTLKQANPVQRDTFSNGSINAS